MKQLLIDTIQCLIIGALFTGPLFVYLIGKNMFTLIDVLLQLLSK